MTHQTIAGTTPADASELMPNVVTDIVVHQAVRGQPAPRKQESAASSSSDLLQEVQRLRQVRAQELQAARTREKELLEAIAQEKRKALERTAKAKAEKAAAPIANDKRSKKKRKLLTLNQLKVVPKFVITSKPAVSWACKQELREKCNMYMHV